MARFFSPCGEKIESQHGFKVDVSGNRVFGKVADINIKDRINTAGKGCTLYEMISKYQRTGDDSFLRAKASAFNADLTVMPKNLIELYNLKSTCVDDFKKFPVDYRALFNHNVDDYLKAVQDNSVKEITDKYFKDKNIELEKINIAEKKEGEKKEGENKDE